MNPQEGLTRGRKAPAYVFGTELIEIVNACPDKLALEFDQSLARGSERRQLQGKLQTFTDRGIHAVAYVSHACLVLLGRKSSLVEAAFDVLQRDSRLPRERFLPEAPQNKLFQGSAKNLAR